MVQQSWDPLAIEVMPEAPSQMNSGCLPVNIPIPQEGQDSGEFLLWVLIDLRSAFLIVS